MDKRKDVQKFVIVTGGVCSSLGKGITAASIGAIFKAAGYKVFNQKLDPYLNVDPGTMSPIQHGEVFVTDDGAETDLDLGHYERFVDEPMSQLSSTSTGMIYSELIARERAGDFLGGTIQIVPHVTNAIKSKIVEAADTSNCDVMIAEIGGTVGDIEGQPFIEAVRQLRIEKGVENVCFVHVTLLPYLMASNELKTKPTQSSVRELRAMGVQPDIIIARSDYPIPDELMQKISLFCDVDKEAVIPAVTAGMLYQVPLNFEAAKLGEVLEKKLHLKRVRPDMSQWVDLHKRVAVAKKRLKIGLVGKYNTMEDSYISVVEALKAACYYNEMQLDLEWVDAEDIEKGDYLALKKVDGLVVPGGFGERGVEGKILAAQYAREHKIPYLGLCLGMQIMSLEFARNVVGIQDANSEEFDEHTKEPVIHFMEDQRIIRAKGGTMRLGAYPCKLVAGTLAARVYGKKDISERHRHRYEFNNKYRSAFEKAGLVFSGLSPDAELVEIVENKDHPFMVGVQFHPEFKSRPYRPHPLFFEFIKVAVKQMAKSDDKKTSSKKSAHTVK